MERLVEKRRHVSPAVTSPELLGSTPPTLNPPPPHRNTLTSDCGDVSTTMRRKRETSPRGRFFLFLMDDFGYFNVICFSFNVGFGKDLVWQPMDVTG